jgi:hypothetical protein
MPSVVAEYIQESRGLWWTEIIEEDKIDETLREAERNGDAERVEGISRARDHVLKQREERLKQESDTQKGRNPAQTPQPCPK